MVYFTSIQPTRHYLEEHQEDVPWDKVVEIISSTKNPRKRGNVFEIETQSYYILFSSENKELFVINAKRK